MKKINVLIVDDRDIIRDGLKLVFSNSKNILIKDEANDGKEAIRLVREYDYDVVLMDINMPNMNGIEATKNIKNFNPRIKVLANSFYESPIYIKEMIKFGASGFIKKGETKEAYEEAIRTVNSGAIYLSKLISSQVYDKVVAHLK